MRRLTHRFATASGVLFGDALGRDERFCIDSPARCRSTQRFTVGHVCRSACCGIAEAERRQSHAQDVGRWSADVLSRSRPRRAQVRLDDACPRRVAGTGWQADRLTAEQAGRSIPQDPGCEVRHAGDVEAGGHLGQDGVVGAGVLTGEVGVPAVAVQLGREQISQPFGDDMLADGDGVRVPDDPARGGVLAELIRDDCETRC